MGGNFVIGGEIRFRDKSTGQFRSVSKEVERLNKTVAAGAKGSKAAAASLKQLRQAADLLGKELAGDVAPSVKRTTAELHNLERQTGGASRAMRGLNRDMGLSASKANAFTRAATRGVAAIGFISPTAATASAQLVGLTNASAAATLAIGAGAVGAIALGTALIASAKAAINFESSFRGIRKTVEATEAEYASLEAQNRKLAKSLGESVNTINEVGKAAGQLGIAIGDISRFEKIVIELVSATDLVAQSASLSLGGLRAVLNLTIDDLDRLTDQLVALGNQFAATEPEIVGLLQRIAGAGAVLKIPARDLLSIATAFASVRVEQQAAGTAIQKVMLSIQRAAVVGGKELETFARMLGITTQAFQNMARSDPTRAFVGFVNALSQSGEQAQLWLEELGLTDQRLRRTFLKMAAAQGVLNEAIREGNEAYEEGTARTEEHEKALDTTRGQLKLAGAAFVDIAISVGQKVTPAIRAAAEVAVVFADALQTTAKGASFAAEAFGKMNVGVLDLVPNLRLAGTGFEFLNGSVIDLLPNLRLAVTALKVLTGDLRALKDVLPLQPGLFAVTIDPALLTFAERVDAAKASVDAATASIAAARAAIRETGVLAVGAEGPVELQGAVDAAKASVIAITHALDELDSTSTDKATATLDRLDAAATIGNTAITALDDAIKNMEGAAEGLDLGGFNAELDALTTKADDARNALFAMFKKPTLEEEKAKLAVLELKAELLKLQTKTTPFTEEEKERAKLLKGRIASAQRLADIERTESAIREKQLLIAQGALQTQQDQLTTSQEMVVQLTELNRQMALFNNEAAASVASLDPTWELMKRLAREADDLTKMKFDFILKVIGEDAARRILSDFMKWGGDLTAEGFVAVIRVDDSQARAQILALAQTLETARTAIAFGALTGTPAEINALAEALALIPQTFESISEDIDLDAQAYLDGAKKAKKGTDILSDGIISLAEALEFGFTVSTAATAELGREQEKLADRLWRTRVETEKIERSYATVAAVRERAILELREAEVEASKKTIELRTELAKLFILMATPGTGLRDAAQLLLENQVAFAEAARQTGAEIIALQVLLGEAGLAGEAATFRNAMVLLDEEFQRAEETTTQFLHRLAQASMDAVQQRFDDLFARPTREQAQLNLVLAEARRRRLLLEQSGNEKLIEIADKEIERIQHAIDLRRAEEDIMRARADIVNATLLTEAEQMTQAQLLIGLMAEQSRILDPLNAWLALETLAHAAATGALRDFEGALISARDALGTGQQGFMTPQRALAAGTPAQSVTMKFELNLNVDAQFDDIRRKMHRELDDKLREQLQDAGLGSSSVSTGTYRPE